MSKGGRLFSIVFKTSASKDLARLEHTARRRIAEAIDALAVNPYPHGALKLEGFKNHWRVLVGNFRIVYEIRSGELVVFVIKIADRKEVYKSL